MWQLPVLFGIAAVTAYFGLGCDGCSGEEKAQDAASPPPETPEQVQQLPRELDHVDDDSWKAFSYLWPNEAAKYSAAPGGAGWMGTWLGNADQPLRQHHRARTYFGAAEGIFRSLHEGRAVRTEPNIARYTDGSTTFFQNYYQNHFDPSHESILVLIGGLAPANLGDSPEASKRIVFGALSVLQPPTTPPSVQRDQNSQFMQVLKAGYHYNEAARRANPKDRYSVERRRGSFPVTRATYDEITDHLDQVDGILKNVDPAKLNDLQLEYLEILGDAARQLRGSVRAGRGGRPPIRPRPPRPQPTSTGGGFIPPPV